MASIEELEQRLIAVEAEMVALREQATDAHTLAAHADHDVAEFRIELRAQTRLLNLTRLDVVEQGRRVTAVEESLAALRTEMVGRFDQVHGGISQIVGMLETLGGRKDQA